MTEPREQHAFRPTILAVDDSEGLRRVERELRKRYEADYRVVCEGSAEAALQKLRGYETAGEEVALVLAAQWMAGTTGVKFLVRAHQVFPTAKRLLMVDMGDSASGRVIPRAMTLGRIDYFEAKPGPPPNERFHEVVTGLLREWTKPYRSAVNAMVGIVGERWSRRSHEARDLLERRDIPYAFYAADSEEGRPQDGVEDSAMTAGAMAPRAIPADSRAGSPRGGLSTASPNALLDMLLPTPGRRIFSWSAIASSISPPCFDAEASKA